MGEFNLLMFSVLVLILIISRRYDLGSKWANLTRLITIVISSFFIAFMCVAKFGYVEGLFPFIMWVGSGIITLIKTINLIKN